MSKLQNIDYNKIVLNVVNNILKNQDLCKLLYYDCENPLEQEDFDTYILREKGDDKRIFLCPYIPVESERKTFLCIFVDRAIPTEDRGGYYEDIYLNIYILSHLDNWEINEGIRHNLIMEKLDEMFHGERSLDTLGESLCYKKDFVNFANNYKGYQLVYKSTDFS